MLQSLGDSQSGGSGELAGLVSGITPAQDLGNGLQAELLDLGLGNQNNGGSTVVKGRRVGGSDSAVAGDEGGLDGAQLIGVKLNRRIGLAIIIQNLARFWGKGWM